jgi:hypothetical protein
MSDWWARRLADTSPRTTQPSTTSLPPTTPPVRFGVQVPVQPQQPVAPAGNQRVLDESRAPTENVSMGEAIRLWKGGEAARRQGNMTCPECGSQHVFVRTAKGGNTMINGNTPAPRCFECGWNGLYDQGSQSSWAV